MSVAKAKTLLKRTGITSRKVAGIAARGLRKPENLTPAEIMIVCASVLVQAKRAA